jgi:hypothetical protein
MPDRIHPASHAFPSSYARQGAGGYLENFEGPYEALGSEAVGSPKILFYLYILFSFLSRILSKERG